MAKRNKLSVDFRGFEEYAEKLDELGADLKSIFTDAMEQAADTVEQDTREAMQKSNLPAKGKYSKGDTMKSILHAPKVTWNGTIGEIPLGFDRLKNGVGDLLISGTPRMQPNRALEDIYARKKYQKQLVSDMMDIFEGEIEDRMGG